MHYQHQLNKEPPYSGYIFYSGYIENKFTIHLPAGPKCMMYLSIYETFVFINMLYLHICVICRCYLIIAAT